LGKLAIILSLAFLLTANLLLALMEPANFNITQENLAPVTAIALEMFLATEVLVGSQLVLNAMPPQHFNALDYLSAGL